MFNKVITFFLFSSIFISICAVALCIETNLQMHIPLNNFNFYCFVFGATLVQYNLHYIIKTEIKNSVRYLWSQKNRRIHIAMIGLGVALILFSFFSFHLRHYIILSLLGLIAFLYSFPVLPFAGRKRIKDFGLLKIFTLSLLWTLVTAWFPVVNFRFDKNLFALIFFKRFFFMFVLCMLFDIRDMETDKNQEIYTLAVICGKKLSYQICYAALIVFALLCAMQYYFFGNIYILTAMCISVIATFFAIIISMKKSTDLIYLGTIDGMMLLQALLIYLAIKF